MTAFYNENDRYAAQWLRNLMERGLITAGAVDGRSVAEVEPHDLAGHERCHFFAGIAGWDLALQLAGWPAGRPVWSASLPCQPFSVAGRKRGFADERHLWPVFFPLVRACRPAVLFGEQSASRIGFGWLDVVAADLESEGYAVWTAVLGAHSVGAPHRRNRIWFVALNMDDAAGAGVGGERGQSAHRDGASGRVAAVASGAGASCAAENAVGERRGGRRHGDTEGRQRAPETAGRGDAVSVADADIEIVEGVVEQPGPETALLSGGGGDLFSRADPDAVREGRGAQQTGERPVAGEALPGAWSGGVWILCADGKARSFEPGSYPLAYGVSCRVARLRAFGNAVVPQVGAIFVKTVMQCL